MYSNLQEKQEVVIEKVVRNKRKCITTVKGLELFGEICDSICSLCNYLGFMAVVSVLSPVIHSGVKLSDASKKLGKKFATGASVVKVQLLFIAYKILDKFTS